MIVLFCKKFKQRFAVLVAVTLLSLAVTLFSKSMLVDVAFAQSKVITAVTTDADKGKADVVGRLLAELAKKLKGLPLPPPQAGAIELWSDNGNKNGRYFLDTSETIHSTEQTITVKLQNTTPVTFVSAVGLTPPFYFKGGSFPGTGGTCKKEITADCTIVLSFSPQNDPGGVEVAGLPLTVYLQKFSIAFKGNEFTGSSNEFVIRGIAPLVPVLVHRGGEIYFGSTLSGGAERKDVGFDATFISKDPKYAPYEGVRGDLGPGKVKNVSVEDLQPPFFLESKAPCQTGAGGTLDKGCILSVFYRPTGKGPDEADLTLRYFDGWANQVAKVHLRGAGVFEFATDPAKNLLIVYNEKLEESKDVKDYYVNNRPGFRNANVLSISYPPIGCSAPCRDPNGEELEGASVFQTAIREPITDWLNLNANKGKDIRYIVLLQGIPTRYVYQKETGGSAIVSLSRGLSRKVNDACNRYEYLPAIGVNLPGLSAEPGCSTPSKESTGFFTKEAFPGTLALVTVLDMGSVRDTKAYIDKLKNMYGNMANPSLRISATDAGVGGTTYYLEDYSARGQEHYEDVVYRKKALEDIKSSAQIIYIPNDGSISSRSQVDNVLGFVTWGAHGGRGKSYATDGQLIFSGHSNWYLIDTLESYNGMRETDSQNSYTDWFLANSFSGTNSNYSATPAGAVASVAEPNGHKNSPKFFTCWDQGGLFADCAWQSMVSPMTMAVGDPWVVK